jgi:hypothetical protein
MRPCHRGNPHGGAVYTLGAARVIPSRSQPEKYSNRAPTSQTIPDPTTVIDLRKKPHAATLPISRGHP